MNKRLLTCLAVGLLGATVALAPPALGQKGGGGGIGVGGGGGGVSAGGGGGGMGGGGMAGGGGRGMGGGAVSGGGGFRGGATAGGGGFAGSRPSGAFAGGSRSFAGSRSAFNARAQVGGPRFGGPRFASGSRFAHHHGRFHHRFHRFGFAGPVVVSSGCWRKLWTGVGPRWVNVCRHGGYGWY